MVINGCLGPRGDGYDPTDFMTVDQAEQYHSQQVGIFEDTAADMVSAITMTYAEEAIGIARAARSAGMPVAISCTVETNGSLPSGQSLQGVIETVDQMTGFYPAYFMINCAHPSHFEETIFSAEGPWLSRIHGLRANASSKSHAELNEAEELDEGDPVQLGESYRALRDKLVNLNVLGGCCGTDHRHIDEMGGGACFTT
jgi:S-methylmethionine-dependent homocysteine/selenocysteine methylase